MLVVIVYSLITCGHCICIYDWVKHHRFQCLLGYFDSSSEIRPIVAKLQYALQEKWTSRTSSSIERYCVAYPPFVEFVSFIRQIIKTKNHPGFMYDLETTNNTKTLGKQQFPTKGRIQLYVIKFVSDVRQAGGFLRVLWFPLPIKLTAMIQLKYCWKWR